MLTAMTERGFRFDVAISIWVLQHCLKPSDDIARLRAALAPAGSLFVLNDKLRCVPTVEVGWVNDTIDVRALLMQSFELRQEGRLDPGRTTESLTASSYWGVFRMPHAD
jgi:hypothetical protein